MTVEDKELLIAALEKCHNLEKEMKEWKKATMTLGRDLFDLENRLHEEKLIKLTKQQYEKNKEFLLRTERNTKGDKND